MSQKHQDFISALRRLCCQYDVHLATNDYDGLEIWHFRDDDRFVFCDNEKRERQFELRAGKYDGQERTASYSEFFATLEQAIIARQQARGYPWIDIYYKGHLLEVAHWGMPRQGPAC